MADAAIEATDEELMLRYGRGDARAFALLYERQRGLLFRFLLRQVRDQALAEELYQEAWSRVIAARERYRPEAKFSTWLVQIAHNLVVDHQRKQRPQAQGEEAERLLAELDAPAEERPEARLSTFEVRRRIQLALEQLPDVQREAFLMRAEAEMGLEEIAEVTGVGRETVKSRLRYAMNKMREMLSS
jgi:RNA polymerase sigma-70 factor, ECF subfamily